MIDILVYLALLAFAFITLSFIGMLLAGGTYLVLRIVKLIYDRNIQDS